MLEEVSTGPRPEGPNEHKLPNGTGMANIHAIVQIKNSSYVMVVPPMGDVRRHRFLRDSSRRNPPNFNDISSPFLSLT